MAISFAILTAAAMMVNVTDAPYNAVPDDGIDDREAIQQAIDDVVNMNADAGVSPHGEEIYFPSGVYDVTRATGAGDLHGLLVEDAARISFRGDGGSSTLRMKNPTIPFEAGDNFRLLDIRNSEEVSVSNLTLDGNKDGLTVVSPAEHFYLIHLTSSSVKVRDVRFMDPIGDGIKVIEDDSEPSELEVLTSEFLGSGRNGLTCHRSCQKLGVSNSRFVDIVDTAIDFEPFGVAEARITGNFIDMRASDALAASLSGATSNPTADVVFSDNVVFGRVLTVRLRRALINNNIFTMPSDTETGRPCVSLSRTIERVSVSNNVFNCKNTTALSTFATTLQQMPKGITFSNNIVHSRIGWSHSGGGAGHLVAIGNQFEAVELSGSDSIGMKFRSTLSTDMSGLVLNDNLFSGFDKSIYVAAASGSVRDVMIQGNVLTDGYYGIYFEHVCPSVLENVDYLANVMGNVTDELAGEAHIDDACGPPIHP